MIDNYNSIIRKHVCDTCIILVYQSNSSLVAWDDLSHPKQPLKASQHKGAICYGKLTVHIIK